MTLPAGPADRVDEAAPVASPSAIGDALAVFTPLNEGEEPEGPALGIGGIAEMVRLLRPYWHGLKWLGPLIIVFGLLASLAESAGIGVVLVLMSAILRGSTDAGLLEGEVFDKVVSYVLDWTGGGVDVLVLLVIALVLLRVCTVVANDVATTLLEGRIGHEVRTALFRSMLHMPFEATKNRSYGEMLTVLNQHSWWVADATDAIANMAMCGTIALAMGAVLFALSPSIAAVAVVGTVGLSLLLRLVQRPAERAGEATATAARQVSARAAHVLQAMRTVRAFSRVKAQEAGFEVESLAMRRASIRSDLLASVAETANQLTYVAMLAAIVGVAFYQQIPFPLILASVALLYRIQPYATQFEAYRLRLAVMLAPVRAVNELVRLAPPAGVDRGARPFAGLNTAIRFEDVRFGYAGQPTPALSGVSFTIPAGGWTLIDGPSGAGKSTVVNLLLRFYLPGAGRITIDDVPLNELDVDSWRSQLSVSGQDVELIEGTVADNIRLGHPDATAAELAEVVEIVGLEPVLKGLENGIETRIGERGLNLSGGQRQRVGIARALLMRPDILILDEATSALDAASDEAIFARLRDFMAGRTVILIGHRLADTLPITARVRLRPPAA
jgi:ATP-binding cassette, subfamily B, bacterial MsbA